MRTITGTFGTSAAEIYTCGLCLAQFAVAEGKAVHLVSQHGARLVHSGYGAYRYEVEVPETHRLAVERPPIYREALR